MGERGRMVVDSSPGGGMVSAPAAELARRVVPRPLIQLGLRAVHRYGETTASSRPLPDFLVIGVKKGGTTSLINWLVGHDDVMSMFPAGRHLKSPHYFDINYWRGEEWYRANFPTTRARAKNLRRRGRPPLVGEASPYYFFHPAVPRRVFDTIPSARMIVLLREP